MYEIHSSFNDCPLVDFTKSVTEPKKNLGCHIMNENVCLNFVIMVCIMFGILGVNKKICTFFQYLNNYVLLLHES